MQHTGKISLSDYGGLVSIRGLCHSNADPVRRFSSGMKTFQKPEFYSVIKKSQSNIVFLPVNDWDTEQSLQLHPLRDCQLVEADEDRGDLGVGGDLPVS